jgi:dipeptidyl-peptidase 4
MAVADEMSFPRQHARTRRFSLGIPRAFTPAVGPDGPLVLFLRTDTGDDPVTHLWHHDPTTGGTTKLVDARELGGEEHDLPAAERARRERAREQAGGIVSYATDTAATVAAFALAGRLHTVEVATGRTAVHPTAGPAFDPRPSPGGRYVAYHAADGLHVIDLDDGPASSGSTRVLASEDAVSWGRAEFIAAEEMGRSRGFWWSGDGTRLAVARVDERMVPRWTIADPAKPWTPAVEHRYPAAGTTNAEVALFVVDAHTGARTEVAWDRERDEYLARVTWGRGPLTLLVQPRDQRTARVLTADPDTGATTEVRRWSDDAWVELVGGSPAWLGERLLTVEDRAGRGPGGTRTLCVDGAPASPAGLQVREVLGVEPWSDPGEGLARVLASPADDPTRIDAYLVGIGRDDSCHSATADAPAAIRREVHAESSPAGSLWIETASDVEATGPKVHSVWLPADHDGRDPEEHRHALEVVTETPVLRAMPRMATLGERDLRVALLLPRDDDGTSPLPVLLDPYGGPHAQRVLSAQSAYLTSQWLADQGFAVLVTDGRGSPGRGPAWERAVHHDLATAVLDDQIDALHAAAELEPRLDLDRVALRGWSFGGYLAALAVLRRPDVFRAGIAGAPVTDWRLYDTHYTERYLGHPDTAPEAYDVSSLIDVDGNLLHAAPWDPDDPPKLLLIHGLADDNVVAAHALRLSSALLADGRPHTFLPLSGVTHMTPQEIVAERLLERQVGFLREAFAGGR